MIFQRYIPTISNLIFFRDGNPSTETPHINALHHWHLKSPYHRHLGYHCSLDSDLQQAALYAFALL